MAVKVIDAAEGTKLGDLDVMKHDTIEVNNPTDTESVLAMQSAAMRATIRSVATLNEQVPDMQADLQKALDAERAAVLQSQEFGGSGSYLKAPSEVTADLDESHQPRAIADWAMKLDPREPELHDQRASVHRYQKAATAVSLYFRMLLRRDEAKGQRLAAKFLESPAYKSFLRLSEDTFGMKVLYTGGTGRGAEWVPAEMWGQGLIDRVRDVSFLAPLMRQVVMGHSTWKRPRIRGSHTWFNVAESSTDLDGASPAVPAQTVIPSRITTDNATWVAGKMGGYTVWSAEQALFQILSDMTEVLDDFLRSGADALDETLLYGDKNASYHTGLAAGDRRRTYDGLTSYAEGASYDVDHGGGNISWRDLGKALGRMDKSAGGRNTATNTGANQTIFICPYILLYHLMYEVSEFIIENQAASENVGGYGFPSPILTRNTYGEGNTVTEGEAAQVFGRPIFPTQFIPKTLDASGAIATPATLTGLVSVNAGLFGFGTARDMELMILTELFATSDAVGAVAFWMGDLQPMVNLTEHRAVDYLYNISTADPA